MQPKLGCASCRAVEARPRPHGTTLHILCSLPRRSRLRGRQLQLQRGRSLLLSPIITLSSLLHISRIRYAPGAGRAGHSPARPPAMFLFKLHSSSAPPGPLSITRHSHHLPNRCPALLSCAPRSVLPP